MSSLRAGPARSTLAAEQTPFAAVIQHWRVVLAAMLGWVLDAFDQMILIFLLVRLRDTFAVDLVAMGLLLSVSTYSKIAGNIGWGLASDRWGRKTAFMVGVVWFSVFSGLTGLAWSYASLFVIRVLFGFGFGGEWSASAALLMESVPPQARSLASAIMMAGFEIGYFMAAAANAVIAPRFGWRILFFIGILPALLTIFIRRGVPESPVWLRTRGRRDAGPRPRFRLTAAAIQGWVFMMVLQFQNTAIFTFYPAFLQTVRHMSPMQVFPYAATYSVASIVGKPVIGLLAARFGQRATSVTYLLVSIPAAIFFTLVGSTAGLFLGAALMGVVANSIFGLVPAFLSRRFPSAHRSFGMGFGYAVAGAGGSVAALAVPLLGRSIGLGTSMAVWIIAGSAVAAIVAAIRPRHLPGDVMETETATPDHVPA
ncbi:MAG TPA: MFS transporter [Acetobacteraceae bacterium]|nr:MFS transporter [Acetobacteraceae bacterium]